MSKSQSLAILGIGLGRVDFPTLIEEPETLNVAEQDFREELNRRKLRLGIVENTLVKVASVVEIVIVEVKVEDEANFGRGCWVCVVRGRIRVVD